MNTFNGGYPAQNPYFGSISPNGLNLGLVNVNPLVSFQFAKDEYGEKTFKPLVNFHVTPNENIINKVGSLFKAKKFGFGGSGGGSSNYNQHYHTHAHYPAPSYHPHHYEGGPPHFEHAPTHYSGPSDYYPSGYAGDYGFSNTGFYHDTSYHGTNNIDSSLATGPPNEFEPSTYYYGRSANGSAVDRTYANDFSNYNQQNDATHANAAQTQFNEKQGTQSVSFPSNRRKRSVNSDNGSDNDSDPNNESIAPKSKLLEKVKYPM